MQETNNGFSRLNSDDDFRYAAGRRVIQFSDGGRASLLVMFS
jgi:hypothetical protein